MYSFISNSKVVLSILTILFLTLSPLVISETKVQTESVNVPNHHEYTLVPIDVSLEYDDLSRQQLNDLKQLILSQNENKSLWGDIAKVVFGGGIVLLTTLLSNGVQNRFLVSQSVVELKISQLTELYGPLNALLSQSKVLYDQLCKVLTESHSEIFQMRIDEGDDQREPEQKRLHIKIDENWLPFRAVTHLHLVYGKGFGVDAYFDEVIEIGKRVTGVIENRAGFAKSSDVDLAAIFGQYLAHFIVLKQVHTKVKHLVDSDLLIGPNSPFPVDNAASFPRELQTEVSVGYSEIVNQLKKWAKD